jgi:hypothetical protein
VAAQMDKLHLRKIDLCDEVFVVNIEHYIGESTGREIEYAQLHKKPLRWLTEDPIGQEAMRILAAAIEKEKARKHD